MQPTTFLAAAAVAFSSFVSVAADHRIQFHNRCGSTITPKWLGNGSRDLQSGPTLGPGASGEGWIPEYWTAGRLYGQDGRCPEPDGPNCTLFECSFENRGFNQCNISLVSGFNVGMSFNWIGGDGSCQGGKSCTHGGCPASDAWLAPDSCFGCLSQCNTPGVGIEIVFCP
ncbi:thaumatin [Pterulicium gracile]|uniref:Thaumatin n=1 Tax=Pterulicium gracile TaxID=1884261 RepID=A0A5C3QBB6_9AGAR|nr:thaumatin [Pterula gracilis]